MTDLQCYIIISIICMIINTITTIIVGCKENTEDLIAVTIAVNIWSWIPIVSQIYTVYYVAWCSINPKDVREKLFCSPEQCQYTSYYDL